MYDVAKKPSVEELTARLQGKIDDEFELPADDVRARIRLGVEQTGSLAVLSEGQRTGLEAVALKHVVESYPDHLRDEWHEIDVRVFSARRWDLGPMVTFFVWIYDIDGNEVVDEQVTLEVSAADAPLGAEVDVALAKIQPRPRSSRLSDESVALLNRRAHARRFRLYRQVVLARIESHQIAPRRIASACGQPRRRRGVKARRSSPARDDDPEHDDVALRGRRPCR